MSTNLGKAYYNAVSTAHANHVAAVGWTTCADAAVELKRDGGTDNFHLKVVSPSGLTAQVLTPFEVIARIHGNPKSIFVSDDYGRHHVQVCGLEPGEDSSNKPGVWIESGEK